MKKVLYILATILVGFTSCTKETTSTTNSNSLASPFTLKYEIVTSSSIDTTNIGWGTPVVFYSNATQQQEYEALTPTTSWSKTVTVTTPNRPFVATLTTASAINILTPTEYAPISLLNNGTMTGKIYVNGNLVASVSNPTIGKGVGMKMTYPIQ